MLDQVRQIRNEEGSLVLCERIFSFLNRKRRDIVQEIKQVGVQTTFRYPLGYLVGTEWSLQRSKNKLQDRMEKEAGLDDILETARLYRGYGKYYRIEPMQVMAEFRPFLQEIQSRKTDTILEIGTAKGGTLYVFSRYFRPNHIISLDLPSDQARHPDRRSLFETFQPDSQTSFVRENSHSEEAVNTVKKTLKGDKIDFLFIDGDHSYEGVKQDFELYSSLVSEGGVIAFHDINNQYTDVPDFWNEITSDYETKQFVAATEPNPGIGLVEIE